MKHIPYHLLLILSFVLLTSANVHAQQVVAAQANRAKFDSLWVEFNQTQDNQKGMLIHLSFSVTDLKDSNITLAIYFDDANDVPLKDHNQKYYTSKGNVALFYDLKPGYATTDYKDLRLFMPYDELDLSAGKYDLSLSADLIYPEGKPIAHFTYYDFTFNQPGKNSDPNAVLDKIWIDYDVSEANKYGMRVHLNFSVLNLKDEKLGIAAYFYKKNGDTLLSGNKDNSTRGGHLALFKLLNPIYVNSVYEDLQLFLPYSEINLPPGKSELLMEIKIIYYDDGKLVKLLKEYPFNFTK